MTFKGPPMSCLKSGVALLGHGVSTFAKYKVLLVANVRRDILRSNLCLPHQTLPLLFHLFHFFCKTGFTFFKRTTPIYELVS